jgi:hypothetical protein
MDGFPAKIVTSIVSGENGNRTLEAIGPHDHGQRVERRNLQLAQARLNARRQRKDEVIPARAL